jgi:rod shape-determining protein MreC
MILRLLAKYRRTAVLASAVLFSFLLMTMEVRREEHFTPFLKRLLLESVSPLLKATTYVRHTGREIWDNYIDLRSVRQENLRLTEEIQALRTRLGTLEEVRRENERLKKLLDVREREPFQVVPAGVVGRDATNWFDTLLIDQGTHHGMTRHLAVIAPGGLVGQVVDVSSSSARVQLITDPVSSVGVLLETSRVTGLLVGGQFGRLRIRYLPARAEIQVGEVVITSGLGGVYPKGIMVGKVVALDSRSGALFKEAIVEPSVDFSQLEEVLVVTRHAARPQRSQGREG